MAFFRNPAVVRSTAGRSPAYFYAQGLVRIDAACLRDLKRISRQRGRQDVRICLHGRPEANFHDMVILQHAGRYHRPHRHADKPETIHWIEGKLEIVVFDEIGSILDRCLLAEGISLIYRVGAGYYHTVVPRTPFVTCHESKPGPYLGVRDSEFPD